MLTGLFKKKDPKEEVRAAQREIRKGVRDVDRELLDLKREEAKLIREIKTSAKQGNQQVMKIHAKALIRVRSQMTKLHSSKAHLAGVSSSMATAVTTQKVAGVMGNATKSMTAIQGQMDPQKINKTMQQFAKENAKMEMAQEMVGDAIDDALDTEETEEETDALVDQVLDEIGVDIATAMGSAPNKKIAQEKAAQQAEEEEAAAAKEMEALNARMANLRS